MQVMRKLAAVESGTVSLVLSGKRQMNRDHIERLSKRFKVSPAVFFSRT
jgi:HTH-type transcriptional regulator/antitoxin HigA